MKKTSTPLFGIAALLLLLLTSCNNNDLPENTPAGKAIPIRIRSLGMADMVDNNSENLARSSSQTEPQTILTPISNGMVVETSIERNTSPLRLGALTDLEEGTHFRVIAVKTGTTQYYSHGDFVVGSGIHSLTSFYVHVGDTYDFICFSHNNQSLPAHTYTKNGNLPTFNISNSADFLWWKKAGVTINTEADVELEIKLEPKLVKVDVILDCNYNQHKITAVAANSVYVGQVYTAGTASWSNGDVTSSGNATNQYPTWETPAANATEHTSNPLIVMPKASGTINIRINASSLSRNGFTTPVPTATTTISFTTALDKGFHYTFRIKFRTAKFAGSNIYWEWYPDEDGDPNTHQNGGHLTFDPYLEDGSQSPNKGLQGVFFKFGSLAGMSTIGYFSSSTIVYVPDGAAWKTTTFANYSDIKYWGESNTPSADRTVINEDFPDDYLGDICRYINSAYRLPKYGEFGTTNTTWSNNKDGWEPFGSFSNNAPVLLDGTYDLILNGYAYTKNEKIGNVYLPSGGFRDNGGGQSATVGNYGYYRTGTANAVGGGYYTNIDAVNIYSVNAGSAMTSVAGYSVRCVLSN